MGVALTNGGSSGGSTPAEGCNQGAVLGRTNPFCPHSAKPVQKASRDDCEAHGTDGNPACDTVPLKVDNADVRVVMGVVNRGAAEGQLGGVGLLSLLTSELPDVRLTPVRAAGTNGGAEADNVEDTHKGEDVDVHDANLGDLLGATGS